MSRAQERKQRAAREAGAAYVTLRFAGQGRGRSARLCPCTPAVLVEACRSPMQQSRRRYGASPLPNGCASLFVVIMIMIIQVAALRLAMQSQRTLVHAFSAFSPPNSMSLSQAVPVCRLILSVGDRQARNEREPLAGRHVENRLAGPLPLAARFEIFSSPSNSPFMLCAFITQRFPRQRTRTARNAAVVCSKTPTRST